MQTYISFTKHWSKQLTNVKLDGYFRFCIPSINGMNNYYLELIFNIAFIFYKMVILTKNNCLLVYISIDFSDEGGDRVTRRVGG